MLPLKNHLLRFRAVTLVALLCATPFVAPAIANDAQRSAPGASSAPFAAAPAQRQAPQQRPPQQPPAQQDTRKPAPASRMGGFSASVEMVRVPVVVEKKDGSFVQNLEQLDFEISDAGKDHKVSHFVSDADPVSVGFLVDASAAMQSYELGVRLALQSAAAALRPDDEMFVLAYGPAVATLMERTTNKAVVAAAAANYTTWDGADRALYDALDQGLAQLEASSYDKRSLIVIGAGGDTASEVGELSVQQHIYRTGVTIHAVELSPRSERVRNTPSRVNRLQTLPEISRITGGLLARRPRLWGRYGGAEGWFEAASSDIITYVKHQYLLHYVPQNPPRPGTWRRIRVLVDGDHKKIRARSGYIR